LQYKFLPHLKSFLELRFRASPLNNITVVIIFIPGLWKASEG